MTNAFELRIRPVVGDVAQLDVDVIVTAANQKLCGGATTLGCIEGV